MLNYRAKIEGEWQPIEEPVWFDRTPCNYGGERLWLLCPHCGKRVAVLYGYGSRFICRHCADYPYSSKNEDFIDRMHRKARKIRKRLDATDNLFEPVWKKPRGMHWKTFGRLVKEERAANNAAAMKIAEKMEMFEQLGWM
ncbi:MAG: hypothetical protein GY753_13945 [Gammaproteobacteria bacterium]|nr:hypothetical protein [Gammaproteobacteria bacterium]